MPLYNECRFQDQNLPVMTGNTPVDSESLKKNNVTYLGGT